MKYNPNPVAIERRVKILTSLGFDVSDLECASITNHMFRMHFDFSSIDETKFVQYAVHQAYLRGWHNGKTKMQMQAREFLGLPSKDENGDDILKLHGNDLARSCDTDY